MAKGVNTYEEDVCRAMEDMFLKGWEASRHHPNATSIIAHVTLEYRSNGVLTPVITWNPVY